MRPNTRSSEFEPHSEKQIPGKETSREPVAPDALLRHELEVHRIELDARNEELRRAQHAVELGLQRYTELFDFAPLGYVVLDAAGDIREVNRAAAIMLAVSSAKLAGRAFSSLVAHTHRPAFAQFLGKVFLSCGAGAYSETLDLVLSIEGTPELDVRLIASALMEGEPRAMVAILDLTPFRRAEAARAESARKDEFIAALSHEWRNPLSPILTGVSLLRRVDPGGEEAQKAIAVIERQAQHLARIVDDLLDVTRVAKEKVRLRRERLELGGLVGRTMADHRSEFELRRVALDARFDPDPIWVDGDATRLIQVVGNLLNNAAKFTPPGGCVAVALRREGGVAVLSVRDNGVGIDPDILPSVFQPFMQAPQTLERTLGGLGLGLAMVKGLVELHGGTVQVASGGPGRGSEFTVRLPLSLASAGPDVSRPTSSEKTPRRRVLVIEDNADAADILQDLLTLEGHDVRVAYDGATGLELARDFQPEVVFCDIGLPRLDGYGVAKAIRADGALRGTYLIALSGYARGEDRQRATDAGFDFHLAKPPPIDAIERVLAEQSHSPRV